MKSSEALNERLIIRVPKILERQETELLPAPCGCSGGMLVYQYGPLSIPVKGRILEIEGIGAHRCDNPECELVLFSSEVAAELDIKAGDFDF